jgi:hypothetical protein
MTPQTILALAQFQNACYVDAAVPTWENPEKTCHVFFGLVENHPTICFEGTIDLKEWVLDDFNPLESADDLAPVGFVHQPSLHNVRGVWVAVVQKMTSLNWPSFYVVGHSKGAREAALFAVACIAIGHPPMDLVLFEPPRIGGRQLRDYLARAETGLFATQTWNSHGIDILTLIPWGFGWEDAIPLTSLQVPDTYGLVIKHKMQGVIAGLNNLFGVQNGVPTQVR